MQKFKKGDKILWNRKSNGLKYGEIYTFEKDKDYGRIDIDTGRRKWTVFKRYCVFDGEQIFFDFKKETE